MNIFDTIANRYSVRAFSERAVERAKIESIFNAVRLAPSARNTQEWRFVLVTDAKLKASVAEAGGQPFLKECPVIVAACAVTDKRPMRCGELAYPIDIAIAIDHLTLAAVAMGLGTCWIGSFDPIKVRMVLNIPEEVPVVELIALGYPADSAPPPQHKNRLKLSDILMENGWQEPWRSS
jgi:nitroreductase